MPKSRFSQRIRNKLNRSKEADVPQIPLQNLQPSSSFLPRRNLRRRRRRPQEVPPQKAVRDAKPEKLLQTVKENGHRKKTKREEEGAAEEEYSESYETPDNDSDSAMTEKKTKTNKKWQDYTS